MCQELNMLVSVAKRTRLLSIESMIATLKHTITELDYALDDYYAIKWTLQNDREHGVYRLSYHSHFRTIIKKCRRLIQDYKKQLTKFKMIAKRYSPHIDRHGQAWAGPLSIS